VGKSLGFKPDQIQNLLVSVISDVYTSSAMVG
jgi:hypothetical protein